MNWTEAEVNELFRPWLTTPVGFGWDYISPSPSAAYQGDVLDDLLGHVLRVELGAELELQRSLLLDVLAGDL